jgi:hypothetical protein
VANLMPHRGTLLADFLNSAVALGEVGGHEFDDFCGCAHGKLFV